MDNLIGTQLGQYTILELIGQGGMASVYRAHQESIQRDVAIKVINRNLASAPEFGQRFQREARLVASLSHPNILKIFDYGVTNSVTYLVMELIPGGSLAWLIRQQGALPLANVVRLTAQIGRALDYAHGLGIVHRDLKPENVLLDRQGNAYLTDFGIAKMLGPGDTSLTSTGVVMGTPSYMPPEAWQGLETGPRSDIYAFGVMVYNMVTGKLPFEAATPFELMYRHMNDTPPTASSVNPALSVRIDVVLSKVLAKDPAKRYPSAGEFASAFELAAQDIGASRAADEPTGALPRAAPDEESTATSIQVPISPPTPPASEQPAEGRGLTGSVPLLKRLQDMLRPGAKRDEAADNQTFAAPLYTSAVRRDAEAYSALEQRRDATGVFHEADERETPDVELMVVASPNEAEVGKRVSVTRFPFVIGRMGADLSLDSPTLSRRHVQITYERGTFLIADQGSSNGTFLNGKRLPANTPEPLYFGSMIRIGSGYQITFVQSQLAEIPTLVGYTLDNRYELLEFLKSTGTAVLYRAKDRRLPREVWVKILAPGLAAYVGYAEQIRREAETAAKLQHTHIGQLLDHGEGEVLVSGGRPLRLIYLVMPLFGGGVLADTIEQFVPLARCLRWIREIASALDYVHARGIVHGGIKPTSILLDANDQAIVTDFAVAYQVGDSDRRAVLGSPAFIAPEQWDGHAPTAKSDQFALAALAYLLLTGSRPFEGQDNPEVRKVNFRRGAIPAHDEARTNNREEPVTPAISKVLETALSVSPERRFATAAEFATELTVAATRKREHDQPLVFISYRRDNSFAWAHVFSNEFKGKHGISAFVDVEQLDGAREFPDRLVKAITNCDVFICLLGENTLDSAWVCKEIGLAFERGKPMIPIFQEKFVKPDTVTDGAIRSLLMHDGIHLLDVRGQYINEAVANTAALIKQTIARRGE